MAHDSHHIAGRAGQGNRMKVLLSAFAQMSELYPKNGVRSLNDDLRLPATSESGKQLSTRVSTEVDNIMAANSNMDKSNLLLDHQNLPFRANGRSLRVHTQVCGDTFIFLCQGRLVFGDECAVLRERVGGMLLGSAKIVINLREVDCIDSAGIGVLIELLVSARDRGGDLKLVSPKQHAIDVLRRTNLHTIFEIYTDDEKAVAAFHLIPLQNALETIADARNLTATTHLNPE